jgi:hypothetical protein
MMEFQSMRNPRKLKVKTGTMGPLTMKACLSKAKGKMTRTGSSFLRTMSPTGMKKVAKRPEKVQPVKLTSRHFEEFNS